MAESIRNSEVEQNLSAVALPEAQNINDAVQLAVKTKREEWEAVRQRTAELEENRVAKMERDYQILVAKMERDLQIKKDAHQKEINQLNENRERKEKGNRENVSDILKVVGGLIVVVAFLTVRKN